MASKPISPETIEKIIRQGIPSFGDTFVDQLMGRLNKISPMQPSSHRPTLNKSNMAKLKYSCLVAVIKPSKSKFPVQIEAVVKKIKPAQEPFVMPKDVSAQLWKKLLNEMLEEKLIIPAKSKSRGQKFKITDRGRRFMENFEQAHETQK
jgi:hypothetical protein